MAIVRAQVVVNVAYDSDDATAAEVSDALEEHLEHISDCGIISEVNGFSVTIGKCRPLEDKHGSL